MSGKAPRQKGSRFEREVVEHLRAAAMDAYRVPLSGAQRGWKGDIQVRSFNPPKSLECKVRKTGLSKLYQWLENADWAVLKQDRQEPIVVLRLAELVVLVKGTQASPEHKSSEVQAHQRLNNMSLAEGPLSSGEMLLVSGARVGAVKDGNVSEVREVSEEPHTLAPWPLTCF